MAKQRFDPERDLRAWADALNAVADLQHELVHVSNQMTMTDDWKWLDKYRAIVFDTLKLFPNREGKYSIFDMAQDLQKTAINALTQLRNEIQNREIERQIEEIYGLQTAGDIASAQDDFATSVSFTREANAIQDKLEKQGITLEETEHPDTVHVLKNSQPWLVFNIADWEWTLAEASH